MTPAAASASAAPTTTSQPHATGTSASTAVGAAPRWRTPLRDPALPAGHHERLLAIEERVLSGVRLDADDGLFLMRTPALHRVGRLANWVREKRHGERAYFVVNRHLNPTNFCVYDCKFCAFYRRANDPTGYRMSLEDVRRVVRDEFERELTEVHIVGGIDPKLPYSYFIDLLRVIKEERPDLHLKAWTMIEIEWFARISKKSIEEVLDDLLAAGLGSCPGGGVEVLSDRVHAALFPDKLSPAQWLDTARRVQRHGVRMNATMLYGHIETDEELVAHMVAVRALQDETKGFMTFIPLAFHPAHTELAHLPGPTGLLDLRTIAVSRLLLDNIEHIKTYWVMQGLGVAQVALRFGADDIDGTVVEEKITHDAGATTPFGVTQGELVRLIREAGRAPYQRDTTCSRATPV
ncbi:MAG: aminofutalosine synthase MqnE [Planctomycetes bacterium]|nr:aminofutalosine synthase MqnE [Planctomycetota bacterium]